MKHLAGPNMVRRIISDYQELLDALEAIAHRVAELRGEPLSAVAHVDIEVDHSTIVQASYYYSQNTVYFSFPLSYAWSPDFEELERQAIEARRVEQERAVHAEETRRTEEAEARDRATYERLRRKYEPTRRAEEAEARDRATYELLRRKYERRQPPADERAEAQFQADLEALGLPGGTEQ